MNYERFCAHVAAALGEFGHIPQSRINDGWIPPGNAATLWREIVAGIDRVRDRLTAPPPELKFEPFTWRSIGSAPQDRKIIVGGPGWWREIERYDPSTWADQPEYWTDGPDTPKE